jgi:hypothetical protein
MRNEESQNNVMGLEPNHTSMQECNKVNSINTSKWIPPLGVGVLQMFQIFETKMQITNLVQIGLSLDYWNGFEAQI